MGHKIQHKDDFSLYLRLCMDLMESLCKAKLLFILVRKFKV